MMPAFVSRDGTPTPKAIYLCALTIQALYLGDQHLLSKIGKLIGGQRVYYLWDPSTFENDCVAFQIQTQFFVVFAGTTNRAQWLGHLASGFVTQFDHVADMPVIWSFLQGEQKVELALLKLVNQNPAREMYVCGHSYGAASAYIFALHLAIMAPRLPKADLITFGEPASYGGRHYRNALRSHSRIVAGIDSLLDTASPSGVDPFSLTPLARLPADNLFALTPAARADAYFSQRGRAWEMTDAQLVETDWFSSPLVDDQVVRAAELAANVPFFQQHFMASSYLDKAMRMLQRSESRDTLSISLLPDAIRAAANQLSPREPVMWPTGSVVRQIVQRQIVAFYYLGYINSEQMIALRNCLEQSLGPTFFAGQINTSSAFVNQFKGSGNWFTNELVGIGIRQDVIQNLQTTALAPEPSPPVVMPQVGLTAAEYAGLVAAANALASAAQTTTPQTPAAVQAQQQLGSINSGITIPPGQPATPNPPTSPIPTAWLPSTRQIDKGNYMVIVNGQAVASMPSRSLAKKSAKDLAKVVRDLAKANGFSIADLTNSFGRLLQDVSGAEGFSNGLEQPLNGY